LKLRLRLKAKSDLDEKERGRGNYLIFGPVINLLLAEFASYQALLALSQPPILVLISKYFALQLLYPVVLSIPIILLILRKNPFSFGLFYFLLLMSVGNLLSRSELFYASLDALYLKSPDLASYLNSIFSSAKDVNIFTLLLNIVWLFVLSQLIWISTEKGREMEERGMSSKNLVVFQWGFAFISTYLIFLIYPAVFSFNFVFEAPLVIIGIIGVGIFIAATFLLSR
jgi:hypothetical protein